MSGGADIVYLYKPDTSLCKELQEGILSGVAKVDLTYTKVSLLFEDKIIAGSWIEFDYCPCCKSRGRKSCV